MAGLVRVEDRDDELITGTHAFQVTKPIAPHQLPFPVIVEGKHLEASEDQPVTAWVLAEHEERFQQAMETHVPEPERDILAELAEMLPALRDVGEGLVPTGERDALIKIIEYLTTRGVA
jgi:hypothetical protein